MGILLKILGFFLIIGGFYGLFVTIPKIFFNVTMDQINPLVIFGIVESQTPASFFDLILSLVIIGIGVLFIKKKSGQKIPR